tara:strand:+ start:1251 stop:1586 length:336 start_codon:yes stop_codon:yes gene_type:complete
MSFRPCSKIGYNSKFTYGVYCVSDDATPKYELLDTDDSYSVALEYMQMQELYTPEMDGYHYELWEIERCNGEYFLESKVAECKRNPYAVSAFEKILKNMNRQLIKENNNES